MDATPKMTEYLISSDEVLKNLNSNTEGLTASEAERRLSEWGRNELDAEKRKSILKRFAEQLMNPMIIVLLVAAAISIIIAVVEKGGVQEYVEALIILAVVVLNSILGVYQESKAEKAIEALKQMSAATAKVRRGNVVSHIPASELVVGDIVLLEAGDSIPADMRLTVAVNLKIEEAALTGESVPSTKADKTLEGDEHGKVSLGDRKNMAYMGTAAVYGRGEGVVTATGMKTEMGKIAGIIQSAVDGETPLQRRLAQLSKILSVVVLGICVVIFALQIFQSYSQTGRIEVDAFMGSFMLAISLAVAAIPEGLAAVVTIVLSIGVTNMAKRNAIIRRLTAVETLGCAQVICSDKTGTLTQNKMTVVEDFGDAALLSKSMFYCNDVQVSPDGELLGDPTQLAQKEFGMRATPADDQPRLGELPFDSVRKMMTTLHQWDDKIAQYTTGAPDEILNNCDTIVDNGKIVPLTPELKNKVIAENSRMADGALRVLGGAFLEYATYPPEVTPEAIERKMTFVGLIGMIDPLRPEVLDAVNECKNSGIKVVMITGDHKETAIAIAKNAGIIETSEQAVSGKELDLMTDEEFARRADNTFVYARVQPDHKVKIVNMWKEKGFVTAMTGDGVNDAPAIKSGDIGIGMGITGTDVTKNVADMVLADDNFATIVAAVGEGRRIYDNIRKTLQFLLSTNLSEVISILVATLMGFVLFKPVHLLFINLITDTVPAVALGMEHAEPGIMKRQPRKKNEGVFSGGLGFNIMYQGVLIAALTLAGYFIADSWSGHDVAMTTAFFTLSMCEICQAFTLRSLKDSIFTIKKRNMVLWGAMLFSLVATLAVIYIPFLSSIFSLVPLSLAELAVASGLAVVVIPIIEIVKAIERGIEKKMHKQGDAPAV
jgi:Ca2+-transporting ATPase